MASTTSNLLRLEKQTAGENENDWGDRVNVVFELLEEAIAGMTTIATTGGTTILTAVNHSADESRAGIIKVTGTLTSNAVLEIPALTHKYVVWNATTGAYTLSINPSGGVPAVIGQGAKSTVICDATDCFLVTDIPSTTVMLFFQTAAPAGWTQIAGNNDSAIRVVSGAGGGTGGSVAFETAFASQVSAGTTDSHILTAAEMPAHTHNVGNHQQVWAGQGAPQASYSGMNTGITGNAFPTQSAGSGGGHTHTFTGTAINLDVAYINVIYCSKD